MNGKTYAYLDVAALPPVGELLLDPRPAFVFRGDGSAVVFANAAAAEVLDSEGIGALLERRFSGLNPIRQQIAGLTEGLLLNASRLETLRIGLGTRLQTLPATCRRLKLADGENAVLAVVAGSTAAGSLMSRAESLADAIGGSDCLAAILEADGRVLAASGGFDELAPASGTIDALIDAIDQTSERLMKQTIAVDGSARPAGALRFDSGGKRYFLLIVGPVEAALADHALSTPEAGPVVAPSTAQRKIEVETQADIESALPDQPSPATAIVEPAPMNGPEPAPPAAPNAPPAPLSSAEPAVATIGSEPALVVPAPALSRQRRFVFALDGDLVFTLASPQLAEAVGARNAAIAGKSWREVDNRLGLDPDGLIGEALRRHEHLNGITFYWPVDGDAERIAVNITALPTFDRERRFAGYRGFGTCHLDDRRPDERPAPSPTPLAATEIPKAAVQPGVDLDDVARKSIEEGPRARDLAETMREEPPVFAEPGSPEAVTEPLPSNVVHLPGALRQASQPERLSGSEQDAFRRIAEALGARQAGDDEAVQPKAGEAPKPKREEAPSFEIDTRVLDRLPMGIVVFRDQQTLFANRPLLDLLAYESFADFLEAGGPEALFPEGEAEWSRPGFAGSDGNLIARRRDGSMVPVEARLNAVTWGAATALMLSIRARPPGATSDEGLITELGSAEERIAELQAILDTATDGVIVFDQGGRVGNINRSAEALFGIEAADILGRSFTDLLAEESHRPALDYLDGLASNGVASVLNDGREVIGKVPRGGLIPLFMTMGRVGDSDKFCAVLRDITHWKNVEEELVAAKRAAETANAQKSDFLAKVSHEIRTPLNAIIGFSEVMMEERFGAIGNERYRNYLRDIHVSGAHLMSLINDLLDLSKIEAGKLDLSFESVEMNAVIQETVALMQPQANRQRIIIRTSLSSGVPNVVADTRSLRQILLNLLSNAIKFTQPGGQVIVSTALEENGEVVLRIRDTGIGMSEKDIETAMKPFRQVATAGRGRTEGTGLGLPLTKALVEANRASFSLDSVVNQGTLVRITFPTTRVLAG